MILVCGEALMDVFGAEPTPSGYSLDARVGGSPFNVAIGLARMRQPAAFLASVSTDFLGDRLCRALGDEGVDVSTVHRCASRTTLGLVGVDAAGVPSYAFYGDGGADRQLPLSALDRLPSPLHAVHLGSYAAVVQPIASTLRALVERLRGQCLIAYDPNLRLNVEPSLEVWRSTVDWMLPRADIVKISDEDLQLLEPGVDAEVFARRALRQGCGLVIVTRGSRGAQGWTAQASAQVPGRSIALIDTVGAGDTFQCATLTWLAEREQLTPQGVRALDADALQALLGFAATAAALTCARRGADMPRREDVDVTPAAHA